MRLTTFTDYNLRVLIYLAIQPEKRATIAEIAKAFEISESHLMKVVHFLGKHGYLANVRGKGGGIRLAREPGEIRLGQVIRGSEGSSPIVECLAEAPVKCKIAPACRLSAILVGSFEAFYSKLDEHTLADLIQQPQQLAVFFAGK